MGWRETNVLRGWLMKWPHFAKLVRQQVGGLWGGEAVKEWETIENGADGKPRKVKFVTLRDAARIHCGVKGLPDYTGYRVKVITPDMVGKKVAIYTAVEGKNGDDGVVSPEQKATIHSIRKDGGIAFVVRSADTVPCDWEPTD
jgi:hypothetical protein